MIRTLTLGSRLCFLVARSNHLTIGTAVKVVAKFMFCSSDTMKYIYLSIRLDVVLAHVEWAFSWCSA